MKIPTYRQLTILGMFWALGVLGLAPVHATSPGLHATQLDVNAVPLGLVLLGNESAKALEKASQADFWVQRGFCKREGDCAGWAQGVAAQAAHYDISTVFRFWFWDRERQSPGDDCSHVSVDAWAREAAGVAEKVSGSLVYAVQLENEPDLGCGGAAPDPYSYAVRTIAASRAIRAVDPDLQVWSAGLAHGADTDFLAWLLIWLRVLGCPDCLDAIAIHHYGVDVAGAVSRARVVVREHGYGLPVIVTEMGYSGDGPVQAEQIGKRLRSCFSAQSPCAIYKAQTVGTGNADFGLLREDGTPKDALATFMWFANTGDSP